jgi:hypothetical protein
MEKGHPVNTIHRPLSQFSFKTSLRGQYLPELIVAQVHFDRGMHYPGVFRDERFVCVG